jgi:hypothetical protein
MRPATLILACVVAAGAAQEARAQEPGRRILPGPRDDGSTLLHNQWPIQPAGAQVALGDFPVGMAIDPGGRFAAVLHAGHGAHEVRLVDLASLKVVDTAPLNEAFCGVAFSQDGGTLRTCGRPARRSRRRQGRRQRRFERRRRVRAFPERTVGGGRPCL